MLALHHLHNKNTHSSNKYTFLDYVIYIVAILSPFMTLPQLYLIWVNKTVAGVSAISWSGYVIFNLIWIYYGIVHKDKPIILTNLLWAVFQIFVVLGVLLNG